MLRQLVNKIINRIISKPAVVDRSTMFPTWILKPVYTLLFEFKHGSGENIMDEDWDTLILLDACRYDDFNEINSIPGELSSKLSNSVDSAEFIQKNVLGREFRDTVYVTANPHVKLIGSDTFHDVVTDPLSNWDSDMQCVKPQEVTAAAIDAHQQYPHKRIVVHYMQPHDPPLGLTASKLRKKQQIAGPMSDEDNDAERMMELVANGDIHKNIARRAYRESLEIVLNEVEKLLNDIDGKVVISSDHGEMFGEAPYRLMGRLYEHYNNPKTIELCKIPWFTVSNHSERREITEGDTKRAELETDELDNQLEALGYK